MRSTILIGPARSLWIAVGAVLVSVGVSSGQVTNLVGEVAMASPPAVAQVGPTVAAPTIPSAVWLAPSNSVFRYTSADVLAWGVTYPRSYYYVPYGVTGQYAQLPYRVEFDYDGSEFEIFVHGTGGSFRLRIDGQYARLSPTPGPPPDGLFYWLKVTFPDSKRRSFAFEASGVAFGGVAIQADGQLRWPTQPLGSRCIVLGDSYSEGLTCYAQRLGQLMTWEVWSSGVGGTGYLNSGPLGRVNFRERVQSDVISRYPDVVIVAGGLNDPTGGLAAEAGAIYDQIIENLPAARLIVVGPWWPRGIPTQSILDNRDALKTAALARNLVFIDPLVATDPSQVNAGWITGTGNAANPKADGNADQYISADGTHPTDLGHQFLALKLAEALRNIVVPSPASSINLRFVPGLWIEGTIGRRYQLQWSENVSAEHWVDAELITLPERPTFWADASATNSVRRFYRALLLP